MDLYLLLHHFWAPSLWEVGWGEHRHWLGKKMYTVIDWERKCNWWESKGSTLHEILTLDRCTSWFSIFVFVENNIIQKPSSVYYCQQKTPKSRDGLIPIPNIRYHRYWLTQWWYQYVQAVSKCFDTCARRIAHAQSLRFHTVKRKSVMPSGGHSGGNWIFLSIKHVLRHVNMFLNQNLGVVYLSVCMCMFALYWLGTRTLFFFFILLFYSQIRFWLPIILWIFSHYSHYSPWLGYVHSIEGLARLDVRRGDLVDVELTIYYRIYTGRKELENEDDRAEKADWRQSQTLLTCCSWHRWMWTSMIPSSQSLVKLSYYSIRYGPHEDHVTWFLVLLFSHNSRIIRVPTCIIPKEIPE